MLMLVYAHRKDAPDHLVYREWLESIINGNAAYVYSELVSSGFMLEVTPPKVFEMPSTICICPAPAGKNFWKDLT